MYTTVAVDGKITLKLNLFYFFTNIMICTTHLRRILPMVEFISLFGWYLDGIVDFFGVDCEKTSFSSRASQNLRTTTHAQPEMAEFDVRPCVCYGHRVGFTLWLRHSFSRVLLGQFSHDLTFDASLPLLAGHPDYLCTKVNAIEITRRLAIHKSAITRSSCEEGNCTDA